MEEEKFDSFANKAEKCGDTSMFSAAEKESGVSFTNNHREWRQTWMLRIYQKSSE
jgi:hypothetical protein